MTTGYILYSTLDADIAYMTKARFSELYEDISANQRNQIVYATGDGVYGLMGDGTNSYYSTPTLLYRGLDSNEWKTISIAQQSSNGHAMAIKHDGTLWGWGAGNAGRLGNNGTSSVLTPVPVAGGFSDWTQVSCGGNFTVGLRSDGSLWSWGDNTYGQLAHGDTVSDYSSPVRVSFAGIDNNSWAFVSCGNSTVGAIKTDGSLWLWGYRGGTGNGSMLGQPNTSHYSSPVSIAGGGTWSQVSVGGAHTLAIKSDGTLWCCGWGNSGRLGNGSAADVSSPVTVSGGGTNWKQVNAGPVHSVGIKTDGTLWTWGYNQYGGIGDGTINTIRYSPVTTITGGTNWKTVRCGSYWTAALKTDGTAWAFGQNTSYHFGNGVTANTSYASPIKVMDIGNNWVDIVVGQTTWFAISDFNA